MGFEQGVSPAQKVDLARGVPPGQYHGIPGGMLVNGQSQLGQFGELAVRGDDEFAGAVFPVKQHGRTAATPGSMAGGQGLANAFRVDFVAGDGQVRPGFQAELGKL